MVSQEEFDIMVDELLNREPISFDMLCRIAQKSLFSKIEYWCNTEPCLCGREFEHDIMQEVQLRLMKKVVPFFLLKDGADGPVNNDPVGFSKWITTVAMNIKRDFLKKVRKKDFRSEEIEDVPESVFKTEDEYDGIYEGNRILAKAFTTVISADISVYKVLTWIAQFLFIIIFNITKIQSNQKIIDVFEDKTLYEMYDMILKMSKQVSWIEITPEQNEKILCELGKPWSDELVYGQVRYKEFFMLYKGTKCGKKSISDWMNRMNNKLRSELEEEYKDENNETGGYDDESSDN